jgi:hypothetical protein
MSDGPWKGLRAPFPPEQIGSVDKGFGPIDFVGHAAVTDRLNSETPDWTYQVEPVVITAKDDLPHVIAVFGTMTIDGVTRAEVGDVERMSRYGDELKKAISDFIVRAAMRFGVALDLWSKEDLLSASNGAGSGGESISQSSSPTSSEGTTPGLGEGPGDPSATSEPGEGSDHPVSPSSGPGIFPLRPEDCDHKTKTGRWLPARQLNGLPVCPRCGMSAVLYRESA